MKKMKGIRILTAWTLAVMMICSCAGSALADDRYCIICDPNDPNSTLTLENQYDTARVYVGSPDTGDPIDSKVTIIPVQTWGSSDSVYIFSGLYDVGQIYQDTDPNNVKVTVQGEMFGDIRQLYVYTYMTSSADVTVEKSVRSDLEIHTANGGGDADVEVKGDANLGATINTSSQGGDITLSVGMGFEYQTHGIGSNNGYNQGLQINTSNSGGNAEVTAGKGGIIGNVDINASDNGGDVTIQDYGDIDGQVKINAAAGDGSEESKTKITITSGEKNGAKPDCDGILIEDNAEGNTIDLNHDDVTGAKDGIEIQSNAGTVDIDANTVTGAEDGIEIQSNAGTVDIDAETVTGEKDGIWIHSNEGEINIDAEIVTGEEEGIHVGPATEQINAVSNTSTGVITFDVGDISGSYSIYIDNNAGTVNINQKTKENPDTNETNETSISGSQEGLFIADNTGTINTNKEDGTPGDVSGGYYGIDIYGNTGCINLNQNDVTCLRNTGISIYDNQGTINYNQDNTNPGDVMAIEEGIEVRQNNGILNVNADSIIGGEVGLRIKDSGQESVINIQANEIKGLPLNSEGTATLGQYGVQLIGNQGKITLNGEQEPEKAEDVNGTLSGICIKNNTATLDLTANNISGRDGVEIRNNSADDTKLNANRIEGESNGFSIFESQGSIELNAEEVSGNRGISVYQKNETGMLSLAANVKNITGSDFGMAVDNSNSSSKINIIVSDGDVTGTGSTSYGLTLSGSGEKDVLVDGTVSGDGAVQLSDGANADNSTLTVWSLQSKNDLISGLDSIGFASSVNYIIRTAQSAAKSLTVSGTEKAVTIGEGEKAENLSWQTAKAEEEVTVTVDLDEDKGLDSLYYYYDDEKKEGTGQLTIANGGLKAVADAINTFKVKMQNAGGMLLGLATHTHEFTVYQSTVAKPTCSTTGTDIYKCAHCNATKQVTVAALEHVFGDWTQTKAPTCEETGEAQRTCQQKGCHAVEAREIPAKNHSFTNYVSDGNAKCGEDGTKTATCDHGCGKTDTVKDEGSALEHSFTNYVSDGNAKCGEDGTKTAACDHGCGKTDTVKDEGSALDHDFGEWTQTKAPTCEAKGEEQRTCKRNGCGAVEKRDVDALGHTEEKDPAVAATCTTAGKTAGSHCSVCGKAIVAQTTVPAKGHDQATPVKENEKAAQVGVAGSYDEVVYCKDCGAELSRRTVTVPALPDPEPEVEPKPEPEPVIAVTDNYYVLSFYEDAGAMVNEVKVKAGTTYTLPTPVREGMTFMGWAVSDVPPTDPSWVAPVEGNAGILTGGTEYKVTENKSFVGVWK